MKTLSLRLPLDSTTARACHKIPEYAKWTRLFISFSSGRPWQSLWSDKLWSVRYTFPMPPWSVRYTIPTPPCLWHLQAKSIEEHHICASTVIFANHNAQVSPIKCSAIVNALHSLPARAAMGQHFEAPLHTYDHGLESVQNGSITTAKLIASCKTVNLLKNNLF